MQLTSVTLLWMVHSNRLSCLSRSVATVSRCSMYQCFGAVTFQVRLLTLTHLRVAERVPARNLASRTLSQTSSTVTTFIAKRNLGTEQNVYVFPVWFFTRICIFLKSDYPADTTVDFGLSHLRLREAISEDCVNRFLWTRQGK